MAAESAGRYIDYNRPNPPDITDRFLVSTILFSSSLLLSSPSSSLLLFIGMEAFPEFWASACEAIE